MVLTKEYMMVVLRKKPSLNGIHCNSLGYVGLLFVKDSEKREELKNSIKPIELLTSLAIPTFEI
jgi:ATP adenylyltransferase/5',5'''-P-1,P-4-tetraphosphate phosphorylase II